MYIVYIYINYGLDFIEESPNQPKTLPFYFLEFI